jgi:hypothetical protein
VYESAVYMLLSRCLNQTERFWRVTTSCGMPPKTMKSTIKNMAPKNSLNLAASMVVIVLPDMKATQEQVMHRATRPCRCNQTQHFGKLWPQGMCIALQMSMCDIASGSAAWRQSSDSTPGRDGVDVMSEPQPPNDEANDDALHDARACQRWITIEELCLAL